MSLAISLETGAAALRAAQAALDTAAHNIANANTPGYSRQVVDLTSLFPGVAGLQTAPHLLQPGLGVQVAGIRRQHDDMLDRQYRTSNGLSSGYQASASALEQIQTALGEPSDHALQAALSSFFNGFRELSAQPESAAARTAAVQRGVTLGQEFNRIAGGLASQQANLDGSIVADVSVINGKAGAVAQLNAQIQLQGSTGQGANDLRDSRDKLLDELSGLVGVTVTHNPDSTVSVSLGQHALVQGSTAQQLQAVPDPANHGFNQIVFASDGAAASFSSGEVHGLIDARDSKVAAVLGGLDQVASGLISAVNAAHRAGFGLDGTTGADLFTGSGAADIAVNAAIVVSPQKLATSSAPNAPGNNGVANAIAALETAHLLNGGTASVGDGYAALVSSVGSIAAQAQELTSNESSLAAHLDASRQAISGVSVDEEVTNLMKYQRSYQAAAQVISVTDSMLSTLVNLPLH